MAAPDEVGVRRPIDGSFRVTSDTAEHALRGVGPATDYAGVDGALPIGTPVVAPFDVSGFRRWGDPKLDPGGRALNSTSPDGRFTFVAQHLSAYKDVSGLVPAGGVIAFSGNSGAFTTGPHLHCYVVADGIRMSMEEAIGKFGLMGDGASAGLLSFATQLPEDDMFGRQGR
jgi:murein DD-endopeptidase MepM/ murein hydrolase activator NlpD